MFSGEVIRNIGAEHVVTAATVNMQMKTRA